MPENIVCRRCGAIYTLDEFTQQHGEAAGANARRGVVTVNCAKCPPTEIAKSRPTA